MIKLQAIRRSACPISCTLELIGDKWSLLIIRDMMILGKHTYNQFLNAEEKISTNILNDRLIMLVKKELIYFTGTDKRKKYYLTEVGKDLRLVLESIGIFGIKHFKGSKKYTEKNLKKSTM